MAARGADNPRDEALAAGKGMITGVLPVFVPGSSAIRSALGVGLDSC